MIDAPTPPVLICSLNNHKDVAVTRPRKELICVDNTPYYHITSRCVRRAYLCGYDDSTQTDYEHRRQWLEDRIRLLSSLFAVDICAYAVLSNHYHLVIKLDPSQAESWSEHEIAQRWQCLFKGPLLIQDFIKGKPLSSSERDSVSDTLKQYRQRLGNLSWFMKCLNEPIARRANQEDGCTGHFWESRYKSQALLSDEALLSAMAYVDLNPIRASMAKTPEKSDHTSIKERINPCFDLDGAVKEALQDQALCQFNVSLKPLSLFGGGINDKPDQEGIPFSFKDYLNLIDWTGRAIRDDKRGYISKQPPTILQRLQLEPAVWLQNSTEFERRYRQRFRERRVPIHRDTG